MIPRKKCYSDSSDFVVKHATAAQILIAVLELPKFGILIARGD